MQNNNHTQILKYQNSWVEKFENESKILKTKLNNDFLELVHIGSTSIPGLSSKPIIDIAIVIERYEDREKFVQPLQELGYISKGPGNERDFYVKGDPIEFHVSICFADRGGFFPRQIVFRDYLQTHETEKMEYDNLKRKLLRIDPSGIETYMNGKTDFVNNILQKAGWVQDEKYHEFKQRIDL